MSLESLQTKMRMRSKDILRSRREKSPMEVMFVMRDMGTDEPSRSGGGNSDMYDSES